MFALFFVTHSFVRSFIHSFHRRTHVSHKAHLCVFGTVCHLAQIQVPRHCADRRCWRCRLNASRIESLLLLLLLLLLLIVMMMSILVIMATMVAHAIGPVRVAQILLTGELFGTCVSVADARCECRAERQLADRLQLTCVARVGAQSTARRRRRRTCGRCGRRIVVSASCATW